ncbi:type II secretory pathway, pseudopilin PulG [Burkholderiales bacterium JOSHI_001]|nr:type II secretory pathway, pseudopilin PulG [Burkholderiales bacterium JOSHI_001]
MRTPPWAGRQRGITYLALLLAVALTSGALAAGSAVWSHQQRREREKQLLWAGDQIRRALERYAATGADAAGRRFPARLEDLLEDNRSLVPRRHLRRLYHDPITHGQPWGLVRDERGGIVAVFSTSEAVPIKTSGFARGYTEFEDAQHYRDWRFAAVELAPPPGAASAASGAASGPQRPRGPVPFEVQPDPSVPKMEPQAPPEEVPEGEPEVTRPDVTPGD